MKKLLVVTSLIAVLGVSAIVGSNNLGNVAMSEATPGVLTIKLVDF
ncbi:hypothetical protein [Terribacillus saccharophilus]|nr:hypothetical protein [Terribacillus saccharophilus]